MAVNPIPKGYSTLTPYLMADDPRKIMDFLKGAFDAKELFVSAMPDGKIMHAEMRIGDSMLMIGGAKPPQHPATRTLLYVYVKDVDATYAQAVKAGGASFQEPANQFYGDRTAGVKDAEGNGWYIGTHVEDVAPDELARRAREAGR